VQDSVCKEQHNPASAGHHCLLAMCTFHVQGALSDSSNKLTLQEQRISQNEGPRKLDSLSMCPVHAQKASFDKSDIINVTRVGQNRIYTL
jgi:hypothetical protein